MWRGNCRILHRRTFLRDAALAATAAWTSPSLVRSLAAQQINDAEAMRAAGASAQISTQLLRRKVRVLMGSGGNIAVLPGRDGKLLVDSGFATSQNQISRALGNISDDPVRHLIDTHWHFDHTDGNRWLHNAGATIIGHENTRIRMSKRREIPEFRGIFPPAPAEALPTVVFSEEKTLEVNGEKLVLQHYGPAHTDSDILVHFLDTNLLHTGDTWFNGVYPFIDYRNGGSLDGMIAASTRNLRVVDDQTIVIPGHGPTGGRAQLAEYDAMLHTVRDRVADLKKQGRSARETVAARPTASFDRKWGGGLVPPDAFVELMHAGIK